MVEKSMKTIFFVRRRTAYEMLRGLVGSEMCVGDRAHGDCVSLVVRTFGRRIPEERLGLPTLVRPLTGAPIVVLDVIV